MLKQSKGFSGFSVDDIDSARTFYRDVLGLEVENIDMNADGEVYPLLSIHINGATTVMAYPKPDHAPASFTILNFPVDDIDIAVDALAAYGVRFEQYGGDIATDEKGICRNGPLIAWFRDPAGNILSLIQE